MYKNMSSDWTGPTRPPTANRDVHNEILVRLKRPVCWFQSEAAFTIAKKDRYIF